LNATARLKRADGVTYQKVAGEAILIRLDTGTYFSLNKAGTEFWEMLDGQRTIEEHAAALAEKNNRIVKSAADGLHKLAEGISREHETEAQTLVDDLRAYARQTAQKYLVHASQVVSDLLELAEKMAADKLVDVA